MAETITAPNNKTVKFDGKPMREPAGVATKLSDLLRDNLARAPVPDGYQDYKSRQPKIRGRLRQPKSKVSPENWGRP